jgi:hypothetical protein
LLYLVFKYFIVYFIGLDQFLYNFASGLRIPFLLLPLEKTKTKNKNKKQNKKQKNKKNKKQIKSAFYPGFPYE